MAAAMERRTTARVTNIPQTATAADLLAHLESIPALGPSSILAIDILTERRNWKSRGHGRVQFQTLEAKTAAETLSSESKLVFRGQSLVVGETYDDIVVRPRDGRRGVEGGELCVGVMKREGVMCGIEKWVEGVRVWVLPERRRVEFWIRVGSGEEEVYKVEIPFEHVVESVVCRVGEGVEDGKKNALLLKVE